MFTATLKIAGGIRYTEEHDAVRCACHSCYYTNADQMVKDHHDR